MKEKEARGLLDQLTVFERLALYDFLSSLQQQTGNSQEGGGQE